MNKHEHKCPYCGAVLTHDEENCDEFLEKARETCPEAHDDLFAGDIPEGAQDGEGESGEKSL